MASTEGHEWLADLTAGRHFTHGIMSVSPFAGLLVSGWRANGFTETGAGIYDNRVNDQTAHSLRTQVGLEGRTNWEFGSVTLQPHVRAAWLSEFSNGARAIGSALDGINYAVVTRAPQRDAGLFNAGLDVVLNPRALLYTDFTAQGGGTIRYYTDWRIGAAIRF
jgi:outer membrane lipase/esterase